MRKCFISDCCGENLKNLNRMNPKDAKTKRQIENGHELLLSVNSDHEFFLLDL